MPKLPNHDKLPQALRHFDSNYDPYAEVTDPTKAGVYKLEAIVYFRGSTDEWVLELTGTINDVSITSRHTAPQALVPEDVPGLSHLYPEPVNRDAELQNLIDDLENKVKRVGALSPQADDDGDRLLALQAKQEQRRTIK